MLNKNWHKVYDPKDFEEYDKLMGTAPPLDYPFQKNILYRLLAKYYRTNKGNMLHPENPRHLGAFFEMLQRTMEELAKQVSLKKDYDDRRHIEEWNSNQERDEDPIDRILREDELKRDSSLTRISLREDIDLGRFWISPDGKTLKPDIDMTHYNWLMQHKELLTEEEQRHVNDADFIPHMLSDGWIRISGGIVQIFSREELPRVADFLKLHTYKEEYESPVTIVVSNPEEMDTINIGEIISQYETSKKTASNVPCPLRQNYDYSGELGGPEWQNRVKNFRKRKEQRKSAWEAIQNARTSDRKVSK